MIDVIDRLVYAAPDLDSAVEELERRLGVRATPGGRHSGEGTRNALIALGPASYIEILAPDPHQSPLNRPLWLGLEGLTRPRLTAWAVQPPDLDGLASRAASCGMRNMPLPSAVCDPCASSKHEVLSVSNGNSGVGIKLPASVAGKYVSLASNSFA